MKTALYLGRFQPYHLGHHTVVKKIAKEYDQIVIAICSAQVSNTKRNPFTYLERHIMMEKCLKADGISNYRIIPIPDIHCPEKWADFCHAIFGDYDVVITNNKNTRRLFENRGDKVKGITPHKVKVPRYNWREPDYHDVYIINGTMIRNSLAWSGSETEYSTANDWLNCVSPAVKLYLLEIKALTRLKKLYE